MNLNETVCDGIKILLIDDHPCVLDGTLGILKAEYPDAETIAAKTAEEAIAQVKSFKPQLVIVDLSIPEKPGMSAQVEVGLQLLQTLMKNDPELNLMVQSSTIKSLVRIKHNIDTHQGGFTVADKALSHAEMLKRADWALQGITYTKDLRTVLEIKPEWLQVLRLAFEQGLQDKAIGLQMYKSERMVRHYWRKIQDVLDVYPDCGKNIRIQTEIKARETGLID